MWRTRIVISICLISMVATTLGCNGSHNASGRNVVLRINDRPANVFFVQSSHTEEVYYLSRTCKPKQNIGRVVCEKTGHYLWPHLAVPMEIETIQFLSNGEVRVNDKDDEGNVIWLPIGTVVLCRTNSTLINLDKAIRSSVELEQIGTLGQPGEDGFPELVPITWVIEK